MKSVAIVCGSAKFDGIYQDTIGISNTLQEIGYNVRFYQAVDPGHKSEYGSLPSQVNIRGLYLPFRSVEMGLNRLFIYPRRIKKIEADEIFLSDITLVGTISDLSDIIVRVPDLRPLTPYRDNYLTALMFKLVLPKLKRAKQLVVYTEFMKRMLVHYGIDADRISILFPLSSVVEDRSAALKHIEVSSTFIKKSKRIRCLYVASDRPYKRIGFYIGLAERFLKDRSGIEVEFNLVSKLKKSTKDTIQKLGLRNLYVYERLDDIDIAYAQCDVLVFPSLYEGFGIPIIEAMFRGIPIVTSDLQPMNEIVSKWGKLCTPSDVDEWRKHILSLSDCESYERQANLSLERSVLFSKENFKRGLTGIIGR